MDVRVQLSQAPSEDVRAVILAPLIQYTVAQTGASEHRALAVEVHNLDGRVTGGLWGATHFAWLHIELLVVPEPLRGRGLGQRIMQMAETEAVIPGCHSAWLDTFEFQARPFYERLGYACLGELKDYPIGFRRFFVWKRLVAEA